MHNNKAKMNETTIDGNFVTWVRDRDFLIWVLLITYSMCISSMIYAIFLIFSYRKNKKIGTSILWGMTRPPYESIYIFYNKKQNN